ncbi:hypothetical protein E2562_030236 [Oryza meyeriana var. granulata]|uniref:Uncharacterized protein n=1 Tax=Oryza meyeriana var. granulata TaxID=110450 RepID=A0A6G1D984_9ORYZ|nr:hypothetical protein E2562_030236 [Oryza meyeriana var. granulata]
MEREARGFHLRARRGEDVARRSTMCREKRRHVPRNAVAWERGAWIESGAAHSGCRAAEAGAVRAGAGRGRGSAGWASEAEGRGAVVGYQALP